VLFGRKTEEKVDKLYRFFSALIGLLIAKGLVTKEELDLAAQPILLLQSNTHEERVKTPACVIFGPNLSDFWRFARWRY